MVSLGDTRIGSASDTFVMFATAFPRSSGPIETVFLRERPDGVISVEPASDVLIDVGGRDVPLIGYTSTFDLSPDGEELIRVVRVDVPPAGILEYATVMDGVALNVTGDSVIGSPEGLVWFAAAGVAVNDLGVTAMAGVSLGSSGGQRFVAVDNEYFFGGGSVLPGVTMPLDATPVGIALNNAGVLATLWESRTPSDQIFLCLSRIDDPDSTVVLVSRGDLVTVGPIVDVVNTIRFNIMVTNDSLSLSTDSIAFVGELENAEFPGLPFDAVIRVALPPAFQCPSDLDGDGMTSLPDLLAVLAAWGPCPPDDPCAADASGNGAVGFEDLTIVLAGFGPCVERR